MYTNIVEYIDKKSNTANIRALSEAIKNKQKVKLRLGLRAKNLLSRNMRENISSDKIFQKQDLLHPKSNVRFFLKITFFSL